MFALMGVPVLLSFSSPHPLSYHPQVLIEFVRCGASARTCCFIDRFSEFANLQSVPS